jgi:hypothetical protein
MFKLALAIQVLVVDPPTVIEHQTVEHLGQKFIIALSLLLPVVTEDGEGCPSEHRWIHVVEVPLVGRIR